MFTPNKKGGGGISRVLPIATIANRSGDITNRYIPGSGVGSTSISVRRHKFNKAMPRRTGLIPQTTVPNAPIITSVTAGYTQATIFFTPPSNNGGQPITSYTVTSNPGNISVVGYSSPITVTGLTNGVGYTFTIIATNLNGNSPVSNTSQEVTPSGSLPERGTVQSVVTFFDDANLGYNTFNNTFSRMCVDSAQNVIVACHARTGTFTINKTDLNDGLTQTPILTDTFSGTTSVTSGVTYYTYNIEIIKYNSLGVPQWVSKIGGGNNYGNNVYDIVSDSNNNIYALVGHSTSIVTYYNSNGSVFGTLNNVFNYGNFIPARLCIIKYNSNGDIQWINTLTAGDNNNQFVYINNGGKLVVDSNNNIYISTQVQRAGGGSGPTSIKFYEYGSVNVSNEIQFNLKTSDSYPFNVDGQWQRGFLIKVSSNGIYDWIARMVIPGAYGEQNSGPINKNIVIDSDNNIYLCIGTIISASSPICNIYNGVSTSTNPLSTLASPYYRLDLRGNSLTPKALQYYKFAAIIKFDSNGVFQRASCVHQLHNGSSILNMDPYIGIDKLTNSLYLSMNAQGYVGTDVSGGQLNKLYINNFTSNNANAANYDIIVSNSYTMILSQPQTILAIVKYNSLLQSEAISYIDTPGGNSVTPISVDLSGNIYVTTTIKDTATTKTIYTFNSFLGSTPTFNTFANINATTTNTDGLIVCYSNDLTNVLWVSPITSSDGLNSSGILSAVDGNNNIYIGGTSSLNINATTNTINLYNYDTVTSGYVVNSSFGNVNVTDATDRVGFIIKYI